MSDHKTPDKPGLWRGANEKTVVACMESGELTIRDADTGMVLSGERVERAAPFRQAEWKGPELIGAGFSAMPDAAGCWCDADGGLWLITGGDGIDGHIFRLKEPGREWECAPCSGITVRMLHEWGPWARCDFNPKDDDMSGSASSLTSRIKEIRNDLPEENVPWKPASDDSTPVHEGSRTVHLPAVRSFGRLERDKWLAVKNLEESAELVEACKQYLKACDPADPSGIDGQFIGVVNCLNIHGAAVGDEPDIDLDKAQADWRDHVRDQRRQAMLGELADVLQTVGNLITAFGITDEEVGRAMDDCLERNRRKGRL